jgi:hypothetical protein
MPCPQHAAKTNAPVLRIACIINTLKHRTGFSGHTLAVIFITNKMRYILLILLFTSCIHSQNNTNKSNFYGSKNTERNEKNYENLEFARVDQTIDTFNVITIDKNSAILVDPGSEWFSRKQIEMSEEDWNEIVADHDYYVNYADSILKLIGIKISFLPIKKRFYKFKKNDKTEYIVDKLKMNGKWGIILFYVQKDPIFLYPVDIRDAIKDLFGNKYNR